MNEKKNEVAVNSAKNAIAKTLSTLTPELLTVAKAKTNALAIADSTLAEDTTKLIALDTLDTASTYARCELMYKVKRDELYKNQFKDFKSYCTHCGFDNSNASKWARVYETIISNDSVFPLVDGFNVSALMILSNCKNFSELEKAITNGLVVVPNEKNNFKGTTNSELSKIVKAINAGVVNVSASNIAEDKKTEETETAEDKKTEETATESKPENVTLQYEAFARWLESTDEKTFDKLYKKFEESQK